MDSADSTAALEQREVAASPRQSAGEAQADRALSLAEVVLLAAATAIGTVSVISLAAAHLSMNTLPNVTAGSLVILLAIAVVATRHRPSVRIDPAGLAPTIAGLVLTAVLVFPGFEYGTGDRDPGAYVEHAVAIARTHSIEFPDDLAASDLPVPPWGDGFEWPALWDKPGQPGTIFPQFYHLWSALLATSYQVGGFTALFNTGPLLAALTVCLAIAVARRLAGIPGAWAAALVLSTNMLEVWQAKYPSAEIFGQMLFLGVILGVVLSIRTAWILPAVVAGAMLALSYLERPDGIVLVLIGWTALCSLLAFRRFDKRAAGFAAGLLCLLPYGFLQAYGLAKQYTVANGVPSFLLVVVAMTGLGVIAALVAYQGRVMALVENQLAGTRRRQLINGAGFTAICGALMLLGFLRPRLFGADYSVRNGVPFRTFDEASLIRLSWFFTLPGLALLLVGFGAIALREWRFEGWVVALPTASLLALYCYHVRNSPYLMWSTRRFVTSVLPGMAIVIGFGALAVYLILRRALPMAISAVAVAVMLGAFAGFGLSQSWPLRDHNENGGSVELVQRVAALAGEQRGIFLWAYSGPCCPQPYYLFGGPLLAIADQSSALLPRDPAIATKALAIYLTRFSSSSRPIFYITRGQSTPPAIEGMTSTKVLQEAGNLQHWAETFESRPKGRVPYPYDFTVYQLRKSST